MSEVGPFYEVSSQSTVSLTSGESVSEVCAADGWPLPSIQWLRNGRLVATKLSPAAAAAAATIGNAATDAANSQPQQQQQQQQAPYMINHHRNLTVSSHLVIRNASSQSSSGTYVCMLNGRIVLKNVTVVVDQVGAPSSAESGLDLGSYYS